MRREPPQVHCSKPPKHTPASNFRAQPARQPRNPAMGQHQNSRTRLRCPDFRRIANLLGASKIRAPLSTWNEHPRTAGDTCRANSSTRIAGLGALPRLSEECQSTENQQNQHASVHLERASKNGRRCMPSKLATRDTNPDYSHSRRHDSPLALQQHRRREIRLQKCKCGSKKLKMYCCPQHRFQLSPVSASGPQKATISCRKSGPVCRTRVCQTSQHNSPSADCTPPYLRRRRFKANPNSAQYQQIRKNWNPYTHRPLHSIPA